MNLSGRLDSFTISFYGTVKSIASNLGIDFIVVGASARDLILELEYNIRPYRATEDIDLGVALDSWSRFAELKCALIQSPYFTQDRCEHRLIYREVQPVDIVPFGEISNDGTISWPPDHSVLMKVSGFEEAYQSAISVVLDNNPLLIIKIASLPSLVVLKIFAWKERGLGDNRDANDIAIILKHYGSPVNEDRLWGEESDLLVDEDSNMDVAGARLIGCDIGKTVGTELSETLLAILAEETADEGAQRLATQMANPMRDGDFELQLTFLRKLKMGLEDTRS